MLQNYWKCFFHCLQGYDDYLNIQKIDIKTRISKKKVHLFFYIAACNFNEQTKCIYTKMRKMKKKKGLTQ